MRQQAPEIWFTFELNWQRLLASLFFGLALIVLTYGFVIRPTVSSYVGRQLSKQISQEITDELTQAVVAGLLTPVPAAAQPAAGGAVGQPVAAAPGAAAGSAAQTEPRGQLAVTPVALPAGATQPTAEAIAQAVISQFQPAEGAQPAAQPGGGPAGAQPGSNEPAGVGAAAPTPGPASSGSGAAPQAPAAPMPTPVVGAPITAPNGERTIEQIVEALPPGEITVTEQKLNEKLAPRVANMEMIESAVVRFVPGTVQVVLMVFGSENLATAGLALDGNRVVVQNPNIDGPLGLLVSAADLVRPLEEELNDTLELAGREIQAVRIEQGQIVVTLK